MENMQYMIKTRTGNTLTFDSYDDAMDYATDTIDDMTGAELFAVKKLASGALVTEFIEDI